MNEIFEKAMWIHASEDKALIDEATRKLNPWEIAVSAANQNANLNLGEGMPCFRKCFDVSKENIAACNIYVSALGVFDLYINGERVGYTDENGCVKYDELKPGWTDYSKRVFYYTYDISSYIEDGRNCILSSIAPGWWTGRIALNTYGDKDVAFIARIDIVKKDGSVESIYTDTTWKNAYNGCILSADIWDGEAYDANRSSYAEMSMLSYDDSEWSDAREFTEYSGEISPKIGPSVQVRDFLERKPSNVTVYYKIDDNGSDYGKIHVSESFKEFKPYMLRKGETIILDMAQNMVGWAHIKVKGDKGTVIKIRYAEMLNDSGKASRGNDGPEGSAYTLNYRSAKSKGYYRLKGDLEAEDYRPLFTFYGFRYIELTADGDVMLQDVYADCVGSVNKETGHIDVDNEYIQKLLQNIMWGQRGNYLSIPTDCPQRDERLGWTCDTQVFANTAAYNADVRDFFHKWLQDARDSQFENGAYTDVIPFTRVVGAGNTAWADAGIIVPYVIYKMYADYDIIRECYESMEKYMDLLAKSNLEGPETVYGDWLAYEPTDGRLLSIAYYAYDAMLMSKMSKAISESKDDIYALNAIKYAEVCENVKKHFCEKYLDKDGHMNIKTQTAYLMALKFDMLPEKSKIFAKKELLQKIKDNGYKLSTGFVGSAILNRTLSEIGASNMAYSLLLQDKNPSWIYSIKQGATTIWERWNSYTLDTGFGDVGMNSFNHYAYGSVAQWMYENMVGLQADDEDPGFRHIILKPEPDNRRAYEIPEGQSKIRHVHADYESYSGMISVTWDMDDERDLFIYSVSIPEKSYATLYLPILNKDSEIIEINGDIKPIEDFAIVTGEFLFDSVKIELAPGKYEFIVFR